MRNLFKLAGLVTLLASVPAHSLDTAAKRVAPAPVSSPQIVMLRFFVSDIERAEKFYRAVFGMMTVQKMGETVRIMIFPGGATPGIILIQSLEEATMNGSFIIQVPDLQATLATAAVNGGTLQNTNDYGVEGLVGPDLAVMMVHAINPYGFAWLRRTTEEGVDLNRNRTPIHPIFIILQRIG